MTEKKMLWHLLLQSKLIEMELQIIVRSCTAEIDLERKPKRC